jgi:ABC-type phosphate transport system substrate-binding protein
MHAGNLHADRVQSLKRILKPTAFVGIGASVLLLLAALTSSLDAQQPAFAVIVNPANPVNALPASGVSRMFLKESTEWPNGWPVAPVDQAPSSPVRVAFSEKVLGRSVRSIKSYWSQQIYSGRGVPPPERDSDAAVVQFVKANRGAIGYVTAANTGTAKVLQIR